MRAWRKVRGRPGGVPEVRQVAVAVGWCWGRVRLVGSCRNSAVCCRQRQHPLPVRATKPSLLRPAFPPTQPLPHLGCRLGATAARKEVALPAGAARRCAAVAATTHNPKPLIPHCLRRARVSHYRVQHCKEPHAACLLLQLTLPLTGGLTRLRSRRRRLVAAPLLATAPFLCGACRQSSRCRRVACLKLQHRRAHVATPGMQAFYAGRQVAGRHRLEGTCAPASPSLVPPAPATPNPAPRLSGAAISACCKPCALRPRPRPALSPMLASNWSVYRSNKGKAAK